MRNLTRMVWPAASAVICLATIILGLSGCGSQGPRSYSSEREREGWIGVYVQDLDRELQRYLNLEDRYGVMINDVISNGPAEEAGLREEDIITKFDGKRIRDTDDLTRAVRRIRPDKKVEVEIIRDRQRKTVQLIVGQRRSARYSDFDRRRERRVETDRRPWLGVRMADINDDLAPYFFVEKNAGVLILDVEPGSPAEKADLKAGDVILEVENQRVRTVDDVSNGLANYRAGDQVELKIKRRNDDRTMKVELERSPHSFHFDFNPDEMRAWKDDMKRWKDEFKHNYRRNWDDRDTRIRIQIDNEVRRNIEREIRKNIGNVRDHDFELNRLGEELGSEMENLGRDLEREMEKLAQELERMEIELRYQRVPL